MGELHQAEQAYRQLTKEYPRNISGYNNLAQVLADQDRYDQALAVMADALSLVPEGQDLHPILRETESEIRQRR